jgi:hypothetical protein
LRLSNPATLLKDFLFMIGFALALTVANLSLVQQKLAQPAPTVTAVTVATAIAQRTATAPAIDGAQTDVVWQHAPKISNFLQFEPKASTPPSFKTEFQVSFDDRNLYVFVRAYDPHPDSIMHALTRRDVRGPSDQIKIIIDSYNDNRTGFEFAVNPDGVKRDFAVFNDGNEDDSWNGVWDVRTKVDEQGWTAEFQIPLSQLRYAAAEDHTFGFGVWRDIERYRERVAWPEYKTNVSGFMSQMGDLVGLKGLSSARRFEVTPYAVTKNVSRQNSLGGFERAQELDVGGDVKFGITPNITLDATINPDFGQVEADPAVLNLTAFETFQRERRPFFVEGTGLYTSFRLNCYIVVDCNTNEGMFYSRRIGRSPLLRDDYGDATTPSATPIAAAGKLTGRTRSGLSFGILDATTLRVEGTENRTAEPFTNYAVGSAQQDLNNGNMGINLIATAVNRSLDEWTDDFMHSSAYTAGASFRNRFAGGKYEFNASLAASRVGGSTEAITRTQQSAVHYFQQPDNDYDVDPNATSLTGTAAQVKFGKYGGGITRFETSLVRQSAGFEVNDLGFLRRADVLDWSTWAALSFRTAKWIYNWAQLNGNHWENWNTSGLRLQNAWNFNGHLGLRNQIGLHAGGTMDGIGETYCDRCTRGGPALRDSRGFYPWFGVNGDSRKRLVPSMWVNLGYWDEGRSNNYWLSPYLSMKLSTQLNAEVGAGIGHTNNNTQWFGNFTDEATGITHYSFAHLDQRTLSMTVRVNYTIMPNMTVEFYGEPFATQGEYSNVREVTNPRAANYEDRFSAFTPPPDEDLSFNFIQLRTNTVMRWEYRPGSTLFVVWAHGRDRGQTELRRSWQDDYDKLFDLHPDNTFLIKVAYWLNR